MKAPLPVNPPVCNQTDSGGGRTRTSGVSLSQIYSLLPSPLGHATGASLLSSVTVRCVPCPIHLSPQTVSLHKLMGDGSGSWSCRESNSGLACCQPLLAVTCVGLSPLAWGEDHPWTGAFGEPARLVDDVHVLIGRIHRPTVRPVRFKFSGFDPLIGNGIKVGFHATRVKREEETVLASILVARLMTVVLAGLRHVANGFRQAIESLSAPLTSSRCFSTGIPSAERASVPPVGFALP